MRVLLGGRDAPLTPRGRIIFQVTLLAVVAVGMLLVVLASARVI